MPTVNFNAPAMVNVNRMSQLNRAMTKSTERVSSGMRINRPSDDVAAHGVSERMRGDIRSMRVASRNVQDGVALINVAESALTEMHSMVHRMRELSIQAANGTNTDIDRTYIMMEIDHLKKEVNFISETTHYNGHTLLNGKSEWGQGRGGYFQQGAHATKDVDFISHKIPVVNTETLGIHGEEVDVTTVEGASESIDKLAAAVEHINGVRANLGAIANRLEFSWKNIDLIAEDNQSYESLLRDTDIAGEMVTLTRDQIINQYCTAMLAQANQTPQTILQLLR